MYSSVFVVVTKFDCLVEFNDVQPSIEIGRVGLDGRGCPKAIHNDKPIVIAKAKTQPCNVSFCIIILNTYIYHRITFWLARVVNIPSENKPKSGPPIIPNIVKAACRTPPKFWATKAVATHTKP